MEKDNEENKMNIDNDIETNRFNTILSNAGVLKHVDDDIVDQDVTFFHKPESISSGFYTAERRIIPLRDKLQDMNNQIIMLVDEIEGTTADQLSVSCFQAVQSPDPDLNRTKIEAFAFAKNGCWYMTSALITRRMPPALTGLSETAPMNVVPIR